MRKNSYVLGMLVFLAACAAPVTPVLPDPVTPTESVSDTAADETITVSGDVVWLTTTDAISLDPHRVGDHTSWNAQAQIFEGLTWFDENHQLQPRLATSFEQIEPTVWSFNLRQNVVFTDGTPFNAYAAALSLNRMLAPETASPVAPTLFDMIERVEEIDDYTLHIHTYFPFSPLPSHLTHMAAYIVSPLTIHEENAGGVLVAENPVGTGPFTLSNRIYGDRIVFTRNPDYWDGAVNFETLTFIVVPDSATQQAMLETGESHGHAGSSINIPVYQSMTGIDYFVLVTPTLDYIGFNLNNPYLANHYVRRAINAAIDRESILYIYAGNATLAASAASQETDFVPQGLSVPVQNMDYARELLAQTPWPNGGFTLRFWYNTGSPARGLVGQILQANLAELGINVTIELIEWGSYLAMVSAGEHDMFMLGWNTITLDADRAFFGMYHSSNHGAPGNRFWYSSEVADALLEAGRIETDPVLRQEIYNELGALLADDLPMIPLVFPHTPVATQGIDGIHVDLRGVPFFHHVTLRP